MRMPLTVLLTAALAVANGTPQVFCKVERISEVATINAEGAENAEASFGRVLSVTSSAFLNGGTIPKEHLAVYAGKDKSPPLSWTGAPAATAQFAVIAEDPDAINPYDPGTPLVTWVVYKIPGTATGLHKGLAPGGPIESGLLVGATQGLGTLDGRGDTGGGLAPSNTTAEFVKPGHLVGGPIGHGGGVLSRDSVARDRS